MGAGVRLELADADFLAFCTELAIAREEAGAGPSAHVSVGQRVDALQVIHGLNRSDAWLPPGVPPEAETAVAIFARHLAPILCETPAMRGALDGLLARIGPPGTFQPPLKPGWGRVTQKDTEKSNLKGKVEPRSEYFGDFLRSELRWQFFALLRLLRSAAVPTLLVVVPVATVLAFVFQHHPELICRYAPARAIALRSTTGCNDAETGVVVNPGTVSPEGRITGNGSTKQTLSPRPDHAGRADDSGALDRALAVLEIAGFDMSPTLLAQHLSATSPVNLHPALYLDTMLTRWPLPADRPIPRSKAGAMAVLNFGLAVAELERSKGAAEAIRARIPAIEERSAAQVTPVFVGDERLPDLNFAGEEEMPGLGFFAGIDPRLAQLAVDDVADELLSLSETVDGAGTDFSGIELARIADGMEVRFGVSAGSTTAQQDLVEFGTILLAFRDALQAQAPLDRSFESPLQPWPRVVSYIPMAAPVLALVWAVLGYPAAVARRLQNWPRQPPRLFHLIVPAPDGESALTATVLRVARALRHTAPLVTASLDIERSLSRTLRAGGYFSPVLRQRRNLAVHLVLIHRRTMVEHEPRRIAALFGRLRTAGVSIALYEYASDPDRVRVFGQPGAPTQDLALLLQEYPDARLILVTKGDEFTGGGAYGVAAATVERLKQWDQRVVVTPVPPGNWGLREWTLSQRLGLPIARAGIDGIPDLVATFPSDPGPVRGLPSRPASPAEWLHKATLSHTPADIVPSLPRLLAISEAEAAVPMAPPPDRVDAIAMTLRRWLGPDGYLWLQACASYPALRYPLTRWLGAALFGDRASSRSLAQLSQLGWFAVGRMPQALAARLRADLTDAQRGQIMGILGRFYAACQPETASPAQDAGRGYHDNRIAYEPDPLLDPVEAARILPAAMTPVPEAEEQTLRQVGLVVMADRAAVVLAVGLLALALFAVWPDRQALPLPPGAWLPAVAVLVVWTVAGVMVLAVTTALRRTRRSMPPTIAPTGERLA